MTVGLWLELKQTGKIAKKGNFNASKPLWDGRSTIGFKEITVGFRVFSVGFKEITVGFKVFSAGFGVFTDGFRKFPDAFGIFPNGFDILNQMPWTFFLLFMKKNAQGLTNYGRSQK